MLTLRLTQHTDSPDHYRVELALEVATNYGPVRGLLPQTEEQRFTWVLS